VKAIPGFFSSRYTSSNAAYPLTNSRSKRHIFPVSSRENTDGFCGDERGSISNIVAGGASTGISRLGSDSTEEIWKDNDEPLARADKKDWHIIKTIKVHVAWDNS
jgi:hypothetical protein